MKRFNDLQKKYRKKSGLSMQALAVRVKLSNAIIADYELGKNFPSFKKALLISRELNFDLDKLLKKRYQKNSNQIEIYPNPTSSLLNIELSYSSAYFDNYRNVIVYNTLGEIFLKQKISSQSFNLNVSEFESGIYFVTITDNNVVQFSEKFIKE